MVYDGSEPAGWDRRETFIAAADAEYIDELDAAGHAWLDSFGAALEGVRFKLNETANCKWRRHFDLGDLVRVYDAEYSIDKVAEIKAISITIDANGMEDIELTVGEPQPSKWELLQAGIGPYSSFGDNAAPNTPTGLTVVTGTTQDNDGHFGAFLRCTWSANVELDLGGYEIKYIIAGQESTKRVPADQLKDEKFPIQCNVSYSVAVRAVDTSGNASAYCTAKTGTTARDLTAPATPTGLVVTAKKKSISITVNKNSEGDWAGNEFHVSTVNNFTPSAATLVHSGKTTSYTYSTTSYVKHYVKVRAYDTANPPNFSPYTVQGSATPEQIGNPDIPDNGISGDKIINIVANKITGQLVNAQIANIEYAKITDVDILDADIVNLSVTKLIGKITSAQIGDLSVDKLTAGSLNVGINFGTGGYLEISGVLRIDQFGINIIGQNALKLGSTNPAYLFNKNDGNIWTLGGFHAASLTVAAAATFQGSVWMPPGKKILNQSGGVVYLQNARIMGGDTGESVRWIGDLNVDGEIKVGAGGISWFTSDVRIDGDLDVWGGKHAIVQTSQGDVRLSAIESPEVWFIDTEEGDLLFDEVCGEGERYYIPLLHADGQRSGKQLVLAKRRGYESIRFGKEQA